MNHIGDDLLSEVFRRLLSLRDRARLASVCRHWRKVSKDTHAAIVWQNVWIDESDIGDEMTEKYASMLRWCGAHGCHIRDLHLRVGYIDPENGFPDTVDSRPLIELAGILFASGTRLQHLDVDPHFGLSHAQLPCELINMTSQISALQRLTMVLPENRNIRTLAECIGSLHQLKVAHLEHSYLEAVDCTDGKAAESLVIAMCRCRLLTELTLKGMCLRKLPAELSAATRLTSLVLSDPDVTQLSDAADALPCSLQRLRLTEDFNDDFDGDAADSCQYTTLPWDFDGLVGLQQLQVTVRSFNPPFMPTGLTSLRLEVPAGHGNEFDDAEFLFWGISGLKCLEELHLKGFSEDSLWPEAMADSLQYLRRLRALGFDTCGLTESSATEILIEILPQLTLLSLRNCHLTTLADALPSDAVHNLRVLDLSGNPLGRPPNAHMAKWSPANLEAFSAGNWASLEILGIRPLAPGKVTRGLTNTAKALKQLLQRQAAAAQPPRPPPAVLCSEPTLRGVILMPEKLLRPADGLAVVDDSL